MKYALAIVLLCLPAPLAAGERCPMSQASRLEIARVVSVRPPSRTEPARAPKIRMLLPWERSVLFEQQIL